MKLKMAGSLAIVPSEQIEKSVTAIGELWEHWEVDYSRFFHFPSLFSTCPPLTPLSDTYRARLRGTWISSSPSSSTASLRLTADHSKSDFILTVTFLGKIHEEHYISKLNFSWPHVSCISGFPARGSRVVFVSYRDSVGQIQKFALRFSALCEIEAFMITLKELMEVPKNFGNHCDNLVSEISSQSELAASEEVAYRPKEDWNSPKSVHTHTDQIESSLNCEVVQKSNFQSTVLHCDMESILEGLPPSFTSLMMSCQAVVENAAAHPTVSGDADLKLQIMRYLDDSSFQDILWSKS